MEVRIAFLFGPFHYLHTICLQLTKLEISIKQLRLDLSQYFSFGNLHFQSSSFFYSAYFQVSWLIYQILKVFTGFAMYNIKLVNA